MKWVLNRIRYVNDWTPFPCKIFINKKKRSKIVFLQANLNYLIKAQTTEKLLLKFIEIKTLGYRVLASLLQNNPWHSTTTYQTNLNHTWERTQSYRSLSRDICRYKATNHFKSGLLLQTTFGEDLHSQSAINLKLWHIGQNTPNKATTPIQSKNIKTVQVVS